jgi:hypothetical protein
MATNQDMQESVTSRLHLPSKPPVIIHSHAAATATHGLHVHMHTQQP